MSATPTVDLDTADADAETARLAAAALRERLEAGEDVPAAELADAEQAEDHARRRLDAARRRDDARREQEAADQLARDREALQVEWAASAREPAELVALRESAAVAATAYLAGYRSRVDYLNGLQDRAVELGFAVDRTVAHRPSPLPALGDAILEHARAELDTLWVRRHNGPIPKWGA